MRILTAASILVLALASQTAKAQGQVPTRSTPSAAAAKAFSPEESAAMAEAHRKKAEAAGACQKRETEKGDKRHLHRMLINTP